MNKIQLSAVTVVLLFVQFLLLQMVHAEELYPVQVNYQPIKVKISNLHVGKANEKVIISGRVKRRSYNSHTVSGHIDLIVMDSNNQILQQGIINVKGLNLRRNRYGRHFSTTLGNELPEGSYIKLGWHHNKTSQLTSINHFYKQSSLL